MAEDHGLTRRPTDAHDIRVLNDLQAALHDSAASLELAARDSESDPRSRLFATLAEERARLARDLKTVVLSLGGSPADDGGSILSKARRAVSDIGHALLRDESRDLDAADDSETALLRRLDAALDDPDLSDVARAAVRRARAAVGGEADDIHGLRESLDSRRDAESPLFPY